jgi:hypothetical protein
MLYEDVRAAKEMLSRTSSADIHLPGLEVDAHLTREELETLIRPHLERTVTCLSRSITGAGLAPRDLVGIFLVGGSSRIPLCAHLIHTELQVAPTTLEQPETVVVEGALCIGAPTPPVRPQPPAQPPPAPPLPVPPPVPAQPRPVSPSPVVNRPVSTPPAPVTAAQPTRPAAQPTRPAAQPTRPAPQPPRMMPPAGPLPRPAPVPVASPAPAPVPQRAPVPAPARTRNAWYQEPAVVGTILVLLLVVVLFVVLLVVATS